MAERRIPVSARRVDLLCAQCGKVMRYDGRTRCFFPEEHHHVCDCGFERWTPTRYPFIEHVERAG